MTPHVEQLHYYAMIYVVSYSGEDTQLSQGIKMLEILRFPVTYKAGSICPSEHSAWST